MLNKKSQMEIMGLAIVIILVILGMLFVVRFIMTKKPAEFKAEFTQTQLASNMVNAFINSETRDCHGMSIKELLKDCGENYNIGGSIDCGNSKSCTYAIGTAQEVFSKTLEEWNLKYQFLVYFRSEASIINLGEACIGEKKSKIFPIPTTTGALNTQLDICG